MSLAAAILLALSALPSETAVVIMDPWTDLSPPLPGADLPAIERMAQEAAEYGYLVVIATNDCEQAQPCRLPLSLLLMAERGDALVVYHGDTDEAFAARLKALGVRRLVYTGFAADACVIGRPYGLLAQRWHFDRVDFAPSLSAALGGPAAVKAVSDMVGRWVGQVVRWDAAACEWEDGDDRSGH
jgi:hypothetical protein